MLVTIAVILLVLWLLGLVSSYTLGGYIHLLLIIGFIVLFVGLFQGRRGLTFRGTLGLWIKPRVPKRREF